jgi:hypothetical protein
MGGRKRKEEYTKGPRAEEAKALAREVFDLKEKLGVSYQLMAKETGMKLHRLYTIKSEWANGKTDAKYMYPTSANALVTFWNAHLVNNTNNNPSAPPEEDKPVVGESISVMCMKALIEKVGIDQATILLEKQGKLAQLEEYIKGLPADELVALI